MPHTDLSGPRVHRGSSAGRPGCLGATRRGAPPGGPAGKAPSLSAGEMSFTAFAEGAGPESNFIKRFILCHMLLPQVWLTVPLRCGQIRLQEGPWPAGGSRAGLPTGAPAPSRAGSRLWPPRCPPQQGLQRGPWGCGRGLGVSVGVFGSEPGQRLAKVGGVGDGGTPPPPEYKGLAPQRWSRPGTPWTRWAST